MADWEAEIKDLQGQVVLAQVNLNRVQGALAYAIILRDKEAAAEAAVAEAEKAVKPKGKAT